jgi:hypothetical protein
MGDVGRLKGPPKRRRDLHLEERQIEKLEAFRAVAPFGAPPFVVIVRRAVDFFIETEETRMAPEMRARYDKLLRRPATKVVGLRPRKRLE